jgi:thiamine kinase-like enzyme
MTELETVLDAIPELAGERTVEPLEGGLTNQNLKVTVGDRAYVVRRWSDDGALLAIDRDNEHENSVKAAAAGVGAEVVAYRPQDNTLVIAFLEGRTMSSEAMREEASMEEIAAAIRRLHGAEPFRDDFDMFAIQPRYRKLADERGFRVPERYDEFAGQVEAIREALAVHAGLKVPCNNDLLAENFILTEDGYRLIDYEYSGNNDAGFELGNVWSESGLSLAQLEELVFAYHGRSVPHEVARARLWGLMSQYGWTLWASIQDGVSTIDFDFWAWGMEKYERAVATFDSAELDELLREARRGG